MRAADPPPLRGCRFCMRWSPFSILSRHPNSDVIFCRNMRDANPARAAKAAWPFRTLVAQDCIPSHVSWRHPEPGNTVRLPAEYSPWADECWICCYSVHAVKPVALRSSTWDPCILDHRPDNCFLCSPPRNASIACIQVPF